MKILLEIKKYLDMVLKALGIQEEAPAPVAKKVIKKAAKPKKKA